MRMVLVMAAGALLAISAPSSADDGKVTVLRGPGSGPLPKLERREPPRQIVAGERFWIVDQASGTVTGCRLEGTSTVGRRRLACARRALPGS
jgi:hypothetical protein